MELGKVIKRLREARDLLGHASVEMTERYAHLAPENLRAAVGVLDRMSRFGHADAEEEKTTDLTA